MTKTMTSTTREAAPGKSKEVAPFLKSLRRMLEEESQAVLRWTTNGLAFEIHDMEAMMAYVLPKYFKHSKYTSFQRQLNYFNFKKWTKSKAVVCTFSNEYFIRDKPDLAWRILRKKSAPSDSTKGTSPRRKPDTPVGTPSRPRIGAYNPVWKEEDMAITVPRAKKEAFVDSFPSPTDMSAMLVGNDIDAYRCYNPPPGQQQQLLQHQHQHQLQPQHHHHQALLAGMDSLDWIDTFMPTFDVHPKADEDVFLPCTMNMPLTRPSYYPMDAYRSLPAPVDFGGVTAAL